MQNFAKSTALAGAASESVPVPQTQPIPGRQTDMVRMDSGGYGFRLDDWKRFDRFLILGSEGGTYYAGERELTADNYAVLLRLAKSDGVRVLARVEEISLAGRAIRQDPAILSLAAVLTHGSAEAKRRAVELFAKVVRTGTHLFMFLSYATAMRGWGKAMRTAVSVWYANPDLQQLVYQITKYRRRMDWTHRDALRSAHPKPDTPERGAVFGYIADPDKHQEWRKLQGRPFDYLRAVETVGSAEISEEALCELICAYRLPREVLPTERLGSAAVWSALVEDMPITALIRNLGKLSEVGVIRPLEPAAQRLAQIIADPDRLRKGRVHPMQILSALTTYSDGHGAKGGLRWPVSPVIVDALTSAFYASFENIEPSGKRHLLCLDVSSSMGTSYIGGSRTFSARMAAAAMAMVTARREPNYHVLGFCDKLLPLAITANSSLDAAMAACKRADFGGTDATQPIRWALANRVPVDVFVMYTDNESWSGEGHVAQVLEEYRRQTGIPAKAAFVAFTATGATLGDPDDAGVLELVGFDASAPAVLSRFAADDL